MSRAAPTLQAAGPDRVLAWVACCRPLTMSVTGPVTRPDASSRARAAAAMSAFPVMRQSMLATPVSRVLVRSSQTTAAVLPNRPDVAAVEGLVPPGPS